MTKLQEKVETDFLFKTATRNLTKDSDNNNKTDNDMKVLIFAQYWADDNRNLVAEDVLLINLPNNHPYKLYANSKKHELEYLYSDKYGIWEGDNELYSYFAFMYGKYEIDILSEYSHDSIIVKKLAKKEIFEQKINLESEYSFHFIYARTTMNENGNYHFLIHNATKTHIAIAQHIDSNSFSVMMAFPEHINNANTLKKKILKEIKNYLSE